LAHTRRFVESVHSGTDVPHELIVVDNGSGTETAAYLAESADVVVRNEENRGFAAAMNQGLDRARGRYVAFCNNDIVLPPGWASRLVAHLEDEGVGIVVPALTNALRKRTVRETPGADVEVLLPFEAPPSAVVYAMRTETARGLGGFGEEYAVASGEDTDLAFKSWVNGLAMVFDSRVLVQHESKGTARNLDDWAALWRRNRDVFLVKWTSEAPDVPRLPSCPPADFAYRLSVARSVAGWMSLTYRTRDKLNDLRARTSRGSRARRLLRLARQRKAA
jgi:GT2 family glycosyltransferase